MSALIDLTRSNRPLNVVIAGSAPGTKGDTGPTIKSMALSGDNVLTAILTDGTQVSCDATVVVQNAAAQAGDAVAESLVFFQDKNGVKITVELPTADPGVAGYAWLNGQYICVSNGAASENS